ncbi:hypothetical protein V6N12_042365 [Hibiscus sabdariffa]|uniref:RNase H type-1 domain-containing protein n=1 Tax=Hibiscus sabdariffa TaxID=183260 RepID=A0ABR2EEX7_9ROSI
MSVRDMVDESGQWDWCCISPWLPQEPLEKIAAAKSPRHGLGADISGWRWEDNQNFTTRSAYIALNELLTNEERVRHHLAVSDSCHVCSNGTESMEDALRLCPNARQKMRCNIVFGSAGFHGTTLVKYGDAITIEFAVVNSCRTGTRRLQQFPWCCLDPGWMKELLPWQWRVVRYISRSRNTVADKLARMSQGISIGETIFERPSLKVIPALEQDMSNCHS